MAPERSNSADIDDLAALLFALDTQRLRTAAVTSRITRAVAEWATARSWAVRTEALVLPGTDAVSDPRAGYLDVVVRRGGGQPDLAIEIDSTQKTWSLDKLRHAASAGMHAIWIRWGEEDWPGVYEDVDVIQLRLERTPAHRRVAPQLALWPEGASTLRRNLTAFRPRTPSTTD